MKPSTSWSQTARTDTVEVFAARIRQLEIENIKVRAELEFARIDSVATARHHATEKAHLEQRISWMKEDAPAFYENPGFVAMVVAIVTVWATLQAVRISL